MLWFGQIAQVFGSVEEEEDMDEQEKNGAASVPVKIYGVWNR